MSARHMVETLDFDIAYGSEAQARAQSQALGDFATGRAVTVIGEVFDEFADPQTVLRLDRLDIDLGPGPLSEAEFEARLRAALRRALAGLTDRAATTAAPRMDGAEGAEGATYLAAADADLDLVWRLLRQGRLPWRAGLVSAAEIDNLVARVLKGRGEALASGLCADPDQRALIARIARQWTPAQRRRLLDLLLAGPGGGPKTAGIGDEVEVDEPALIAAAHADRADAPGQAGLWLAAEPDAAAWEELLALGPVRARARLRDVGRTAAWRSRLAVTLTVEQWERLLDLWSVDRPALDLILRLLRGDAAEAMTGTSLAPPASGVEVALLDQLLVPGRDRLPAAVAIRSLVVRRASFAGIDLGPATARLIADWPLASRARLRAALEAPGADEPGPRFPVTPFGAQDAQHLGPGLADMSPAANDGPGETVSPQHMDLEAALARAEAPPGLWRTLVRVDPAWLANRLRHHGRAVAWRRAFARQLDAQGVAGLVALWLPAPAADVLTTLIAATRAWAATPGGPPADMAMSLREALLQGLLLPQAEPVSLASVIEALVLARARQGGGDPHLIAEALARALPPGDADGLTRRRVFDLQRGAPVGPLSAAWLQRLPRPLPPMTAQALAAVLAPAEDGLKQIQALDEAQRRDLLIRLAPAAGPRALEVADRLGKLWIGAGLPPPTSWAAFTWRVLLEALAEQRLDPAELAAKWVASLLAVAPARGRAALRARFAAALAKAGDAEPAAASAADIEAQASAPTCALAPDTPGSATPDPSAVASTGGSPEAAAPTTDAPGAGPSGTDTPEPGLHAEIETAVALGPDRPDDVDVEEGGPLVLPHGVLTGAWVDALPARLPAAMAWALADHLAPLAVGLARTEALTPAQRRTLLIRIAPLDGPPALALLDRLARIWAQAGLPAPPGDLEAFNWRQLLQALVEEGRTYASGGFARRWFEALAAQAAPGLPPGSRAALGAAIVRVAAGLASDAGDLEVALQLRALASAGASPTPEGRAEPRTATPDEPAAIEALYVANAGLVLAGPYIPMLFERLGVTQDGAFVDPTAPERGVHLLQLMADGGAPALEHQLVLNKILCGLDLAAPLTRGFEADAVEREVVDSLVRAMIGRWSIIGETSVTGFRESFLQRQGALTDEGETWRLKVEPRAFDMLIDQIPWGFQTLKLPWMERVLHVDWR